MSTTHPYSHQQLKAEALRLGFSACGVARAGRVDEQNAEALGRWLRTGSHATMHYMAAHTDLRLDPRLLLPGAQSIVVVALNYFPRQRLRPDQLQFAYYAYGRDYHDVMRQRLRQLATAIADSQPDVQPQLKICCDTVPMLDRYWAWQAGLGWIGKNTNLIIPHAGSFFFIGEIIIDKPFDHYDQPQPSRCGTCEQCLKACPTGALHAPCQLDATRCLSFLTIENRDDIPPRQAASLGTTIYGCDRCQLCCPHNRHAQPTDVAEFEPTADFLAMQPADWRSLSPDDYRRLFRGSAVKRAKYEGLLRNISKV